MVGWTEKTFLILKQGLISSTIPRDLFEINGLCLTYKDFFFGKETLIFNSINSWVQNLQFFRKFTWGLTKKNCNTFHRSEPNNWPSRCRLSLKLRSKIGPWKQAIWPQKERKREVFQSSIFRCYCWWKKLCTTWHVWNPANNGTFTISTGARFLPSTVN